MLAMDLHLSDNMPILHKRHNLNSRMYAFSR